jgi:hypothetical protein
LRFIAASWIVIRGEADDEFSAPDQNIQNGITFLCRKSRLAFGRKAELEGIVSKRLGSRYRSERSPDWLKFKNPEAPAFRREGEEDWGR